MLKGKQDCSPANGIQELFGGWPDQNQEGFEDRACRGAARCPTWRFTIRNFVAMRGRRFRAESHHALCQVSRQRSWDLEKRRRHRRAPPGTARLAQAGCSSRLKHSSVPTCEHFGRAHHRHKPFRTSSPAPNSTGDARRTTPTPSAGNGPACSRIGKGASLARVSRMVGRAGRTRTGSAGLSTRSGTSAVAMSVSEVFHWITSALGEAGISYMLTGSCASAYYGAPRTTQGTDLVIAATADQLRTFVQLLSKDQYDVDLDAALEGRKHQSLFNVVDMATGWKIDLIIRKSRPFSEEEFRRR
jgi:hypothetical protein